MLSDSQDTIKYNNIYIMGVLGEEREKGTETLFEEIMAENTPNLKKSPFVFTNTRGLTNTKWDKPRNPQ